MKPLQSGRAKLLGIKAKGRDLIEGSKGCQLRDEAEGYQALFEVENSDFGIKNASPWDINP